MTDSNMKHEGHRERLRLRFLSSPDSLKESELLELLLTFAIPRRDVGPLAAALIGEFGSLDAVLSLSPETLEGVAGIGDSTVTLIQLIQTLAMHRKQINQPSLFETANQEPPTSPEKKRLLERKMRIFANDEIVNTIDLLPKSTQFRSLEAFRKFLYEKLPYNAAETRQRRANYIIERFFPEGHIEVPITFYLSHYASLNDLRSIIFYHLLKAEPIAAKVAEELIWPALPIGRIEREQMREFVMRYLPDAGASSQKNMLRALFYTYDLLGIGSASDTILRFQLHKGTLESFLYILTSEFPQPGIYPFDALYSGPMHRWMLWDREWIRLQLYNLQDFGILTKVSEIDKVRQFTLAVDQPMALRLFFEQPELNRKAIREQADSQDSDQEK